MTEEREIVGFVLPFAAGITACIPITTYLPMTRTGLPALLLTGLFLLAARLSVPRTRKLLPFIAATAFFLGIFCMSTSSLCRPLIRANETATFPSGRLQEAAAATGAAITALPFEDGQTSALLKAFITGDRSDLSRDTTGIFRKSGASHLLALSGLHLGILYLLIQKVLSLLGRSPAARRIRFVLLILAAGSYTLATGASPSLVRAFLFILLNETARLTCRPQPGAQVFMAALCLQLVFSPESLFSTGFQLSYLAVAGIIYLYPRLKACWAGNPREERSWMYKVWNSACLSISCQLTTAPLVWIKFGSLPLWFLLTNLIAIPLTGILIPLALICTALHSLNLCPDLLIALTGKTAGLLLDALSLIALM